VAQEYHGRALGVALNHQEGLAATDLAILSEEETIERESDPVTGEGIGPVPKWCKRTPAGRLQWGRKDGPGGQEWNQKV
jgi:hypothetical protein